jgi:hypothetical protein
MKKLIAFALVLTTITFVSCTKEVPAPTPVTPYAINVEYRVYGESGHLNIEYTAVDNGVVVTPSTLVDRTNFVYNFNWTNHQSLNIKASNATPSGKEVRVEIYVNGVLFKSGAANAPNASAIAQGVYN